MNALEHYRKGKGWTQTRIGKEIGVTFGAICNYERGRRVPPLAKREFIAKVTRGAVPVWCWGWQVFVFEDAKTWPDDCGTILYEHARRGEPIDGLGFVFCGEGSAEFWKMWGTSHYRRKGNDDES